MLEENRDNNISNIIEAEQKHVKQEHATKQDPEPETQVKNEISFSQEEFDSMEAKLKKAGKKEILKQLGIDETALPQTLEKFHAFIEAEKNKETDADKLKSLSDEFSKLTESHTEALAKIEAYEREKVLRSHGINDEEDIEIYSIRIGKLLTDGESFANAAKKYFEKYPKQKSPVPHLSAGTGKTPTTSKASDPVVDAFRKGAGLKNKKE